MSEPKSEYKVEVKNLTKYFGDLHVLNDISFNVRKGEFICIVGPTGCGKTTFLNLLTRIYMESPPTPKSTIWPLCFRSRPLFPGRRWRKTCALGWS